MSGYWALLHKNVAKMGKNRITLEKNGRKYELVKTDDGMNSCLVCAFSQLCVCTDNGVDELPCTELSPKSDHHFILMEKT